MMSRWYSPWRTSNGATWWPRLRPGPPRAAKRTLALVAAIVVAGVGVVVGVTKLETDTTPKSFLPAGDPTLQTLDEAARSFGGDPIIVLAESHKPRELLGRNQIRPLMALEGRLARLPDVAVVYGPGTVVNQIAGTAQNFLATLSGRRDALRAAAEQKARSNRATPEEVEEAGKKAVAKFDQRYGALLIKGLPAGLPTTRNPEFVNSVIFDEEGLPRSQWKFVVPDPNHVAIMVRPTQGLDQEDTQRLVQSVRSTVANSGLDTSQVTVTGSPAMASDLAERVKREIPLLGAVAVTGIAACYLVVPWLRRKRHRLLPLIATLSATAITLATFGWLGRPLSLGVVAFLPILVGIGSDFPAYLVRGAQGRHVLVTALASAAGFGALAASPMPFVRDLGLALALGILLATAFALLLRKVLIRRDPDLAPEPVPTERTVSRPHMSRIKRLSLFSIVTALAAIGWVFLPKLPLEANPEELAAGLPALAEAQHAQDILGSTGEVQILVRGNDVLTPKALGWMRGARETVILRHGDELRPIISPPDLLEFLGPSPSPGQVTAGVQQVPAYLMDAVVRNDGRAAVLSFGIQLQDLGDQHQLLRELRKSLPPVPDGLQVQLAGLPVAAARGYELISGDLYLTNTLGILAAGLILLIGLSRRTDAFRAAFSAALATGWGLAIIWMLGISLTPLTAALGSLTTATACEFTVLLRQAYLRGRPSQRTVFVVATAAGLGYLALIASGLAMVREFGLLLAVTVGLSLVASYIVVRLLWPGEPALLDGDPETQVVGAGRTAVRV